MQSYEREYARIRVDLVGLKARNLKLSIWKQEEELMARGVRVSATSEHTVDLTTNDGIVVSTLMKATK